MVVWPYQQLLRQVAVRQCGIGFCIVPRCGSNNVVSGFVLRRCGSSASGMGGRP